MKDFIIRDAVPGDVPQINGIYAGYVKNYAVTFDITPPSDEAYLEKMRSIQQSYPFLVAESGGEILGFTYATALRNREAYSHCAETTIYVKEDLRRRGIGSALYTALASRLKKQGIKNLYACVAFTGKPDKRLTNASTLFHEKAGYTVAGRFKRCGKKFGRYYDINWMQKLI